ncbi:MAG: hypothetical protein V4724_26520 [Pseudomonadota bacterium]
MQTENTDLRFQLAPEAQEEIAAFTQQLALLPEHVAQGFFDEFLRLLEAARLEVSVADSAAAPGAGNHVIRLRIAGYVELVAAAARAVELHA